MAKDKDVKNMIKRVNVIMDKIEKLLSGNNMSDKVSPEVEKDRVAYKEGLVDGICMMSWVDEVGTNWVGEKDDNGEGKLLSDVLIEIGSVFGFDGKEQLKRVKTEEIVSTAKKIKDGNVKVTDMKGKDVEVKDEE